MGLERNCRAIKAFVMLLNTFGDENKIAVEVKKEKEKRKQKFNPTVKCV